MYIRIFYMLLVLLLGACEKGEELPEEVVIQDNADHNNTIINTFPLYESYFDKLGRPDREQEQSKLYQTEVINPIYDECFQDGEFIHMSENLRNNAPPLSMKEDLENSLEEMNADHIHHLIFESLEKSRKELPSESHMHVCIFPSFAEPDVNMFANGDGSIIAMYSPGFSDGSLKATIAHEYHHTVWAEENYASYDTFTVLDNIILEGKAVMFENLLYPDESEMPTNRVFNPQYWKEIEPYLETDNFEDITRILNGGGNLPHLYGYSEGYNIMKAYLEKNPYLAAEEWLGTHATDILKEADYPPVEE